MSDFDDRAQHMTYEELVQPGVDKVVDGAFVVANEQGGGLGARNNSLSASRSDLGGVAQSTLNWPRTTGRAWGANNEQRFSAAAPSLEAQAAQDIESRWA